MIIMWMEKFFCKATFFCNPIKYLVGGMNGVWRNSRRRFGVWDLSNPSLWMLLTKTFHNYPFPPLFQLDFCHYFPTFLIRPVLCWRVLFMFLLTFILIGVGFSIKKMTLWRWMLLVIRGTTVILVWPYGWIGWDEMFICKSSLKLVEKAVGAPSQRGCCIYLWNLLLFFWVKFCIEILERES